MDEEILIDVWEEFRILEQKFNEINYNLPICEENYESWSLKLGDILLASGCVFDSFLNGSIQDNELDNCPDIDVVRSKNRANITDFKNIFNTHYNLFNQSIYVKKLKKTISPLEDWNSFDSLDWWKKGYNKLKHDRFSCRKSATLKRTLYSLASNFLLFVSHIPCRFALISFKIIKNEDDSYARWAIKDALSHTFPNPSCIKGNKFFAESILFSYFFTSDASKKTDEEYNKYYDPFIQDY